MSKKLKHVEKYVESGEQIKFLLRGVFKEWLIVTDKKVYIIKKGFWTGNIFQTGLFKIQFNRLDAVNATTERASAAPTSIEGSYDSHVLTRMFSEIYIVVISFIMQIP